ncbi:GNAT family N-acetyltransferase [Mycoplasmatota bacterium zrk1]
MNFKKIDNLYHSNPLDTLATALWKIKNDNHKIVEDKDRLMVLDKKAIIFYYPKTENISLSDFQNTEISVIHSKYLKYVPTHLYNTSTKYFKLIHILKKISSVDESLTFKKVELPKDIPDIVNIIRTCYENLHVNEEIVNKWTTHPTYNSNLWIWILDKNKDKMALGIAEFDKESKEGALEWIQVYPEYQGKGLGRSLVNYLLLNLRNKAKFVTVSGEIDNITKPEKLYRKCGFTGDAVWHLFKK